MGQCAGCVDCRPARLVLVCFVSSHRAVAIRFRSSSMLRAGSRAALCMCDMFGGAAGMGSGRAIAKGVAQRVGCRGVGLPIWAEVPCEGVASVWVGGVEVEGVLLGHVSGLLDGGGAMIYHAVGRRLLQCLRVWGLRDQRWEAR